MLRRRILQRKRKSRRKLSAMCLWLDSFKLREGSFEALENMAAASLICADVTDIDTTNFRPASRYLHFQIFSWNFRI